MERILAAAAAVDVAAAAVACNQEIECACTSVVAVEAPRMKDFFLHGWVMGAEGGRKKVEDRKRENASGMQRKKN